MQIYFNIYFYLLIFSCIFVSEMDYQEILQALETARINEGLSYEGMAERFKEATQEEYSRQGIQNLMKNKPRSMDSVEALAEILGFTLRYTLIEKSWK